MSHAIYTPAHPQELVQDQVLPCINPYDYPSEEFKKYPNKFYHFQLEYTKIDWSAVYSQYTVSKSGFHRGFVIPLKHPLHPDQPQCAEDYKKRTIPLLSEKQYDKAFSLFKEGLLVKQVQAELDILDEGKFISTHVNYDPNYCRLLKRGEVYAFASWMKNRNEENPRIWSQVMRNEFNWACPPQVSKISHIIDYKPDKPAEAFDNIINAVANGSLDAERAKILTDIIANSYSVRQITKEQE